MNKPKNARVFHAELWGTREGKYRALAESDVSSTEWTKLAPQGAFYLFTPQDRTYAEEYNEGWSLPDVMLVNSAGIIPARDGFVVDVDRGALAQRIDNFADLSLDDSTVRQRYFAGKGSSKYPDGDTRGWKLPTARRIVAANADRLQNITTCLYRPFDYRWIYYSPDMVDWPRPEVMRHMIAGRNLGLITTRQTRDNFDVLATTHIIAHKSLAAYDINTLFPLYLYPTGEPVTDLFDAAPAAGRRANLAPEFIADIAARLGMEWVPDGEGDRVASSGRRTYSTTCTPSSTRPRTGSATPSFCGSTFRASR